MVAKGRAHPCTSVLDLATCQSVIGRSYAVIRIRKDVETDGGGVGAVEVAFGGVEDGFHHGLPGFEVIGRDGNGGLDELEGGRIRREKRGSRKGGFAGLWEASGFASKADSRGVRGVNRGVMRWVMTGRREDEEMGEGKKGKEKESRHG